MAAQMDNYRQSIVKFASLESNYSNIQNMDDMTWDIFNKFKNLAALNPIQANVNYSNCSGSINDNIANGEISFDQQSTDSSLEKAASINTYLKNNGKKVKRKRNRSAKNSYSILNLSYNLRKRKPNGKIKANSISSNKKTKISSETCKTELRVGRKRSSNRKTKTSSNIKIVKQKETKRSIMKKEDKIMKTNKKKLKTKRKALEKDCTLNGSLSSRNISSKTSASISGSTSIISSSALNDNTRVAQLKIPTKSKIKLKLKQSSKTQSAIERGKAKTTENFKCKMKHMTRTRNNSSAKSTKNSTRTSSQTRIMGKSTNRTISKMKNVKNAKDQLIEFDQPTSNTIYMNNDNDDDGDGDDDDDNVTVVNVNNDEISRCSKSKIIIKKSKLKTIRKRNKRAAKKMRINDKGRENFKEDQAKEMIQVEDDENDENGKDLEAEEECTDANISMIKLMKIKTTNRIKTKTSKKKKKQLKTKTTKKTKII